MSKQHYFIKGDISGIQEFIFNVKSEKAARVLKARSIFVQVLSLFAEDYLKRHFGEVEVEEFYNGGGSFFLTLDDTRNLEEVANAIKKLEVILNHSGFEEDIYVSLSVIDKQGEDFADYWQRLQQQSDADKLRKYQVPANINWSNIPFQRDFFADYKFTVQPDKWQLFGQRIPQRKGAFNQLSLADEQQLQVFETAIKTLGQSLNLADRMVVLESSESLFFRKIQNKLPEWEKDLYENYKPKIEQELKQRNAGISDNQKKEKIKVGNIIDYKFLAHFAYERTGTEKLGILKMDVDNLGKLFRHATIEQNATDISEAFADFFEKEINTLLDDPIPTNAVHTDVLNHPTTYRSNIYTIFSGGDDCIFVGGWDTILEWAKKVNDAFQVAEGTAEKVEKMGVKRPTLSAGVIIVDETYPVIRFAKLVEDAISQAKSFKYPSQKEAEKNKICVFNEVLTWDEFEKSREIADLLTDLVVNKQEPRGTLERIRRSAIGYKKLQDRALQNQKISSPKVANLFYYIRNSRNAKDLGEKVVKHYANDLLDAFVNQQPTNPMKYPVAARWAEFKTRRK